MKKLLFLLILIPFLGNSQATFTAPVGYNTGAPTATPSGVGTRWRFDLLTGKKYTWLPGSLSWDEDARGIDQVAGCSAPLYTPGYNQSTFAVNSCTVPELYQWTGAVWVQLNEGEVYTAGTGISIDGSNVITNTTPNVVQTLSIAGQDLTLSNGGGTVEIPAGSSLGTGFTSGGGEGTIPTAIATLAGTLEINVVEQSMRIGDLNNAVLGVRATFEGGKIVYTDDSEDYQFAFEPSSDYVEFRAAASTFKLDGATGKIDLTGNGVVFPSLTTAQRNALAGLSVGQTIYNTNATATDGSTGVMQVWNGSVWKNAW